jgi:hypothetical protein
MHAFSALWRSVAGLSQYLEIRTVSMIVGNPYLMADTRLNLVLPKVRSVWRYLISMLSFSPICWSCSLVTHDLLRHYTPWLRMNAPTASGMTCTVHGMWFLNAGHSILESSSVDYSLQVIELFQEVWSVVIPSKQPSVSSKQSSMPFKCTASLPSVCLPLTYHPVLAFETRIEQAMNLIESKLYFRQCMILILIVISDRRYGQFVGWCPFIHPKLNQIYFVTAIAS